MGMSIFSISMVYAEVENVMAAVIWGQVLAEGFLEALKILVHGIIGCCTEVPCGAFPSIQTHYLCAWCLMTSRSNFGFILCGAFECRVLTLRVKI
jgi:hypothetical protein